MKYYHIQFKVVYREGTYQECEVFEERIIESKDRNEAKIKLKSLMGGNITIDLMCEVTPDTVL